MEHRIDTYIRLKKFKAKSKSYDITKKFQKLIGIQIITKSPTNEGTPLTV